MNIMPKKYREIDFDSDQSGEEALQIMLSKKCLYDVYKEIYENMMNLKNKFLLSGDKILEIGSGGGFMKNLYPNIITSDVREIKGVDMQVNAMDMPFEDNSLDAILGVHVIHHIPDINAFFKEADRVLKPGGGIVCVEPYWSPIAKFLYKNIHPEPFDESAEKWELDLEGPMSGSNQALSYILLKRDKEKFKRKYPQFSLEYQKPFGFIRYIATGGIWLKPKLPEFMFPILKGFEYILTPIMPFIAIHHIFVLRKNY